MKKTWVKAVSCLAVAFLIASIIAYYSRFEFYGILTAIAVPLCIITAYLGLTQKKKGKITLF